MRYVIYAKTYRYNITLWLLLGIKYQLSKKAIWFSDYHYFIPSFAEFCTSDVELNKRLMEENDIHYPIGKLLISGF